MTRTLVALAALLILILCAPVAMAQTQSCSAPPAECARQIREMLSGKKYLGVKLTESRKGLIVSHVAPESPADRYGLRVDDRVIAVNGKDCTGATVQKFKEIIGAVDTGRKVSFVIDRAGYFHTIDVRIEVMTKEQIDQVIAAHLREGHGIDPH